MKYHDHKSNRSLDPDSDGCSLEDWGQLYGKAPFAKHSNGFIIFISPQAIADSDEYSISDPYTVEQNLDSEFHRRRIQITIDLVREATSMVQGIPRILDLGCGQGHINEKIRQAMNSAELSGMDCSVSAIAYAHEHFPKIDFVVADAYDSPYATGYFDLVVCNNLWEHVPDPLFLLKMIRRILKPGGFLIVSTPSRYRTWNLVRILRGKPVAFMSPHHVTEYTVGQVVEQLTYGGFRVMEIKSKPISMGNMPAEVARRLFSIWISLVGSRHQLEATIFYLAENVKSQANFFPSSVSFEADVAGER